jgi:hypothetical protein
MPSACFCVLVGWRLLLFGVLEQSTTVEASARNQAGHDTCESLNPIKQTSQGPGYACPRSGISSFFALGGVPRVSGKLIEKLNRAPGACLSKPCILWSCPPLYGHGPCFFGPEVPLAGRAPRSVSEVPPASVPGGVNGGVWTIT